MRQPQWLVAEVNHVEGSKVDKPAAALLHRLGVLAQSRGVTGGGEKVFCRVGSGSGELLLDDRLEWLAGKSLYHQVLAVGGRRLGGDSDWGVVAQPARSKLLSAQLGQAVKAAQLQGAGGVFSQLLGAGQRLAVTAQVERSHRKGG